MNQDQINIIQNTSQAEKSQSLQNSERNIQRQPSSEDQQAQQNAHPSNSSQQQKLNLNCDNDDESKLSNKSLNKSQQQNVKQGSQYMKQIQFKDKQNLGNIHPSIIQFFEKKQPDVSSIINAWKVADENSSKQFDELKAKFNELCTFPKAFFALKNFHLKLAQSDQIFAQTFYERETQENDKHSSVIHKACQDGAGEQQITLLVNSHLQKQEVLENQFKTKFEEQELVFLSEYEQLINQLYEQRQEFLHLKLNEISDSAQQNNLYEDFLSEIQSFDSQSTQQQTQSINGSNNNGQSQSSAYSQLASNLQNFMTGNNNKQEGNKYKIQLCLGLQKKSIFQIQICNKSIQSVFSTLNHLKKAQYENNPYSNFIYGQNGKNAIINIMTSSTKFNHHFKRYFKFRTDIHFPSYQSQYQDACQKKSNQEDGDVIVTRHSCSGKAHYMFTVVKKEENKKLNFNFFKQVIKLSNELQIKKVIIPIQLIIMQQKDLKTNSEILKEFCVTLKRELQILSFDYSYSQQFLRKIQIILPIENNRMREMYDKIKDVLLSVLE